jgi:hypothetical protein
VNTALIITSSTLQQLNRDAQHRNRSLNIAWLNANLDQDGLHLLEQILLHNEVEWRCRVLMKVKGTMEPETGWIDVSFENWKRAAQGDTILRKALDMEDKVDAE